jgi:very-short-patch-repair endonuclease
VGPTRSNSARRKSNFGNFVGWRGERGRGIVALRAARCTELQLIKIRGADKSISIILEYDGFKEHFTDFNEVDAPNYGLYMKSEDVERQKVLESYGYRFLRLNRFNLGKDPVRTLDERLARIAHDALQAAKPHPLVDKVKEQTNGVANGDMRQCSVCGEGKSIEEFRDMKLARGYGRKCQSCKTSSKNASGLFTRDD